MQSVRVGVKTAGHYLSLLMVGKRPRLTLVGHEVDTLTACDATIIITSSLFMRQHGTHRTTTADMAMATRGGSAAAAAFLVVVLQTVEPQAVLEVVEEAVGAGAVVAVAE